MKNILSVILSVFLLLAGTTLAVEKKEKPKAVPAQTVVQPNNKKGTTPIPASKATKSAVKDTTAKAAGQKYDDFIDLNHNGIDDRKENLVKKEAK